jgi:nucleotide-binding universal stress UspA family protein
MHPYTIQNILVPIDLSEHSFNALDSAVSLAKKHKATICLLYVADTLSGLTDLHPDTFLSSQANIDVLMALAGSIKHTNNISLSVLEEEGNVIECIIRKSLQLQCDLIVIGTHGASGFRDGFMGSTAYNVIKYSACPVLTIPPKRKITSFKKVLFPIRPVAGALLPYSIACHFLPKNAELDILGLSYLRIERETTVLDKIVDEIRDQLENERINVNTTWGHGMSIANDIIQYAQQSNPDLIVVTSALDAIPKSNFIGPHAQKVIHASKVPILNIKKQGVAVYS